MQTINHIYTESQSLKRFITNNNIPNSSKVLLQVFCGKLDISFIELLLKEIQSLLPDINIVGTTTCGEICDDKVYDESVVLSFSIFENTEIDIYSINNSPDSFKTANSLIDKFDKTKKAKVAISFVDGLHTNGEIFIKAFEKYNKNLIISGGLAGDNEAFSGTIVFTHNEILENGVVVALLYNDNLQVTTSAKFGWQPIGKKMTITKSIDNVVYEIDNMTAKHIYARYLGKDIADGLPNVGIEFPLIVKRGSVYTPRAIIGVNDDESLVFAGNLYEGDIVTFGYGDIEAILNNDSYIIDSFTDKPIESIFVYSCMARKKLLGKTLANELLPLSSIAPTSGFFTYGEFYSDVNNSSDELLNQTMTILALSEKDEVSTRDIKYVKFKEKRGKTLKAFSHLISTTSKELEDGTSFISNLLESQNDFINYASVIQSSLLPMEQEFEKIFTNYFVVNNTQKINSKIYTLQKIRKSEYLLTILDSKQDDLKGLFSTIFLHAIEKQIVSEILLNDIEDISASWILDSFTKKIKQNGVRVDFDGAMLYYNMEKNIIRYASNDMPLYYIQDEKLHYQKDCEIDIKEGIKAFVSTDYQSCKDNLMFDFDKQKELCTNSLEDKDILLIAFEIDNRPSVIAQYDGTFTQKELISCMDRIEDTVDSLAVFGSLSTIFAEQYQNIMNYAKDDLEENTDVVSLGSIRVQKLSNGTYEVITSNILSLKDKEKIEPKLIEIKSLDKAGIKKRYRELRKSGENSHDKGGGIGFYEIAKRCSDIEYNFVKLNDNKYRFEFKSILANKK